MDANGRPETFEENFFEFDKNAEWHDKVHGWVTGSWVQGGAAGVDNRPIKELANRTEFLKRKTDAIIGLSPGGFLDAYDFETDDPTQQALTDYALLKIGGEDPLAIWNGTRVKNLFDGNIWILTNTPETIPPIFEWSNNGPESIAIDGNSYANSDPFIIASDKRKLTVKAGTKIKLGSRIFSADADMELDVEALLDTGALTNGKDYYIFLCPAPQIGKAIPVISLVKTNPDGYDPEDVLLIGGFHTLCADAGSGMSYVEGDVTKSHPLNGYIAKDILPYSVWCLNHRPFSEPEGMVYIPTLDIWVDIYLQSGSGATTASVYQGAITRTRQYVDHVEDMFCVKKELLDDGEFAASMIGSNEGTSVAGANEAGASDGGAGGRVDTVGRRMLSIYGIEEGCGSVWQWLRTTSAAGRYGQIYQQLTQDPTYGYVNSPSTAGGDIYGPYDQSGGGGNFASGKGKVYGIAGALSAGGYWSDSTACGSRARSASNARSNANSYRGGRGRSRTRR